jgi:hypothetical protein
MIFRDYIVGTEKNPGLEREIIGKVEGMKYLNSKGIKAVDGWGETIVFQIIEKEIFDNNKEEHGTSLMDLKYSKYEMD